MSIVPSPKMSRLAVALASVWILIGALFKLFAGTPNDLPVPVLQFLPDVDPGLKLHLAVAIELVVVVLGLLAPALGWFWVTGCLAVFVLILARLLGLSEKECGCFGTAIQVHPALMLSIDAALLLAILATRPWRTLRGAPRAPLALVGALAALAVAAPWLVIEAGGPPPAPIAHSRARPAAEPGAPAATTGIQGAPGATTSEPASPGASGPAASGPTPAAELPRWVVLSPLKQGWVGKHVRDTELGPWVAVDDYPLDAEWILFRYTCDHCRDHFLKLDSEFATNPKMYVLVHIPDDKDETHRVVDTLPPHFEPMVELPRGTEWVGVTPWTLELEAGIVKRVYLNEGEEEDSARTTPREPERPAGAGK